jgi:hypothetical protein
MTRRQRATCATSLVVSLGFVGLSLLPTSLLAQVPTFGQPTISGIQGVGFEQDLRLDPTNANRVYTSVPGSLSSNTSWIWHSEDGGKTFKWVTAATAKVGKPTTCAGGGDTELAVDSAGHLYFNDLTVLNFSTARSGDHGATFFPPPCSNTGVLDAAVDRQWYAVDGDPTTGDGTGTGAGHNIYLANDEIGPGGVNCPVSGVGNNELAMYRSPVPGGGALAGIQFGPGYKISGPILVSCDEGIMGNNEVSPVATTTGQPLTLGGKPEKLSTAVKHVYVIHDDASFSKIFMGRCFPVPFTGIGPPAPNVWDPSGLNCIDLPVASFTGYKTGGNFPTMAIDMAGTLYAIWEQAQVNSSGQIVGDTVLMYSFSSDEGNTWLKPIPISTPGLHNNVFAWPAAGDAGRVDIAFYGTLSTADPNDSTCGTATASTHLGGPDATHGTWSLYMVQTLNGNTASPNFTAPILAGEHYIHKGTIQTVLGGQCGNRTLGDFLQVRVGSHGEAQISYADSNNADESFAPHGMYVKQNGGTGLFAYKSVHGAPILLNAASDPAGDAKRETLGMTSGNIPNLDILESSFSRPTPPQCHPPNTPCYRVKMIVNDLSSLTPPTGDSVAVWLTQWLVPADKACTSTTESCTKGGKNFFVYFESNPTATVSPKTSCWSGENAAQIVGGGVALTYPGMKQIDSLTAPAPGACSVAPGPGPFWTITIDVPIADVSLDVAPFNPNRLYSVTASTMVLTAPNAETPAPTNGAFSGPIGGNLFDLIDVARAYDVDFTVNGGGGGGGGCHEGDGDGHIQGEKSGEASFHVDEDACEDNDAEHVDANDPSGNMDFHSTQITSVAFDDVAHTFTVAGLGTDNGLPVAFTIVGVDSSLVPPGLFSISLSDGYTNSGSLLDGSIRLH